MKKIIIAMLLILPLIIVATVLLSADIISHNVYIAVDNVELNYQGDTLEVDLDEKEVQLVANVYPMAARNKDVYWEIENYSNFGEDVDNAVTISNNGLVKFSTYCAFDAVVTTKEGYKSDRLNIIVKSGDVDKVSITMDSYTILTGESKILEYNTVPIDGEIRFADFVSDNPEVLEITSNGILMAKKAGTAKVSIEINNDEKIKDTKVFTVQNGLSTYGTEFYLEGSTTSLDTLGIRHNATVISGGSLSGNMLTISGDKAILDVDGDTIIINKCNTNDIMVQNYNLLATKKIKLGTEMILKGVWKDVLKNNNPEVLYYSSDKSVATIDSNGKIIPISRGSVTFTVALKSNLSYYSEIALEVINPIKYIRLDTNDNDDKRGILNDGVIGNKMVVEGNIVANSIELGLNYPIDGNWDDFVISLSDTTIAKIEGHTVVFNDTNIDGQTEEIVTVTARNSAYKNTDVRERRTFKVVEGVNCNSYDDMVLAVDNNLNICLSENITYENGSHSLETVGSVYGNGYIVDATNMDKPTQQTAVFKILGENVVISNITIRCDDTVKINDPNGLSGVGIGIGDLVQEKRSTVKVEYCIIGNAYWAMEINNCDVEIVGCIFRNISNFGMQINNSYNELREDKCNYSNITMNNNLMSNIIAPAIGISTLDDLPNGDTLPIQSKLHITGFMDVYNWQDLTSAKMLDRAFTGEEGFDAILSRMVKKTLAKELQKDKYKEFVIEDDDTYYLHLGIITAGAMFENTSEIIIDDERFNMLPLDVLEDVSDMMESLGMERLKPVNLYIYKNTSDINQDSTYTEDKWLYKRLRGEQL
ncbi:MAG: hypothetical protein WCR54_04100 [Clostridia bacterium]